MPKNIDNVTLDFKLNGEKDSVDKIESICSQISEEWNIDDDLVFKLNLILEELIANTVFYGFSQNADKYINIRLQIKEDVISMKISDNAAPFNPIAIDSKPKDVNLENKEIGGLGIHLVKSMSSKIEYNYNNGENILLLEVSTKSNNSHYIED